MPIDYFLNTKIMKKKSHVLYHVPISYYLKWLLMAKFLIIFLFACVATGFAKESKAQKTVSLRFEEIRLKNLLTSIEEQTDRKSVV